ncbi:hypothetical protein [Endozoicomonas ascidiicola]|uniref:hypothetical protein n=1 Tax=Endozoicomonas ascidiicola TaxID=1698521 RepID=UPI0012FE1114|nr:hypothetical protein [Endozoicomonas ascidiicola]
MAKLALLSLIQLFGQPGFNHCLPGNTQSECLGIKSGNHPFRGAGSINMIINRVVAFIKGLVKLFSFHKQLFLWGLERANLSMEYIPDA